MSKAKLFVLHDEIDKWLDATELDLQSDSISLPDLPGPLSMEPAIHVTRQVAGEEDTADLVGKIMPVSGLDESIEYFQNSLIAGDNAYEAVEGFLISSETTKQAADSAAPPVDEQVPSRGRDEAPTDIDILLDVEFGMPAEPEPEPAAAEPQGPTEDEKAPEDWKDASPEDMLARLILEKLK
jgi:hypothetical protein